MKILVAILGCKNDEHARGRIRGTWMPSQSKGCIIGDHVVDFYFFLGEASTLDWPSDTVQVPRNDKDQTAKMSWIIRWAFDKGYDYLFKCDMDTYVHVGRLLASGFEKHPWSGGHGSKETGPYGGSGYWLNRELMGKLNDYGTMNGIVRPWDEDRWVGGNLVLLGYAQQLHLDWRYNSRTNEGPEIGNDIITTHWYAEEQSYSGPAAPPPRIVSTNERITLIKTYHEKAQGAK